MIKFQKSILNKIKNYDELKTSTLKIKKRVAIISLFLECRVQGQH